MNPLPKIEIEYIGSQETVDPRVRIDLYNVLETEDSGKFPLGTTISQPTIERYAEQYRFALVDSH